MKRRAPRVGLYMALSVAMLVALFPFWWMLVTSFKRPIDIFAGVSLVPSTPPARITAACSGLTTLATSY